MAAICTNRVIILCTWRCRSKRDKKEFLLLSMESAKSTIAPSMSARFAGGVLIAASHATGGSHARRAMGSSRLAGSGRIDAGKRPEDAIQPHPVELVPK
jgi:hypothetical protein